MRHKNPTNRKADLKAFYSVVCSFPIDKIISIDETSLTPFMFRPYSRCPLGDKCIETTNNNKVFTKHTFVGAISSSRMMGWKLYEEGAMNADRFVEFVRSIITEHHLENHLFLFDNAGAHKGDKIKKLMTETNNHFLYTIPYNPDTNIIENWFSQFKFYMETSKTRTFEELQEDCEKAIGKITKENYENYFRYGYQKETYPKRKKPWKSTHRKPHKNYKE
jgi:transposase